MAARRAAQTSIEGILMTPLAQQLDQLRQRARARASAFDAHRDAIRADQTLTDYGKSNKIARAYVEARLDVRALRDQEDQAVQARKAELERSLFGWERTMDVNVIRARRESNELADALDNPREAMTAFETAKLRSDDMHVRAIFARALSAGWSGIVNDYLTMHPARKADAQELANILYLLTPEGQFIAISHYHLSKPNELSSVDLTEYEWELTAERNDLHARFTRQLHTI